MRRLWTVGFGFIVLSLSAVAAAPVGAQTSAPADSGIFIVMHGRDTVAKEWFARAATELRGKLVLTEASRGVQQYTAVLAPDATVPTIEVFVRVYRDSADTAGRVAQRARFIFKDDSAAVDALTDEGIQTRLFASRRGAIPYLNLSFALLEQAVRRARVAKASGGEIPFFNLGGGETVVGKVVTAGADSAVVTIGDVVFNLQIGTDGRILRGRIPTQNVVVERR